MESSHQSAEIDVETEPASPCGDAAEPNIAVFRALQLGDMLCAVPGIRAYKKAHPRTRITLIGLPWAAGFALRFPQYFNDFLSFPGYPGLPEQPYSPNRFREFMKRLKSRRFDLLVQMQGNGTVVNGMLQECGIPLAGYYAPGTSPPPGKFLPYPDHLPEVMRHLQLAAFLGAERGEPELEFPVLPHEAAEYTRLADMHALYPGSYAIVHPGARDPRRCWPPEHFARVADTIAEQGYRVVITGTPPEAATVSLVEERMQSRAINLCGGTSAGALTELLRNARLLFGNDTGISHLAAAAGTRSIVLFLTSDPDRWGPLDRDRHRRILPPAAWNLNSVLEALFEELKRPFPRSGKSDRTLSRRTTGEGYISA